MFPLKRPLTTFLTSRTLPCKRRALHVNLQLSLLSGIIHFAAFTFLARKEAFWYQSKETLNGSLPIGWFGYKGHFKTLEETLRNPKRGKSLMLGVTTAKAICHLPEYLHGGNTPELSKNTTWEDAWASCRNLGGRLLEFKPRPGLASMLEEFYGQGKYWVQQEHSWHSPACAIASVSHPKPKAQCKWSLYSRIRLKPTKSDCVKPLAVLFEGSKS